MKRHLCLTSILLCLCACLCAQDSDSTIRRITDFPNRLFNKIRTKSARLDNQLDRQTEKYLLKLVKKEAKIQRKLSRTDSNAAKNLFAGSQEKYQKYIQQIKEYNGKMGGSISGEYLPYVDSLSGSLSFLQKNKDLITSSGAQGKIASTLTQFNQFQSKLQQTEQIKQFIRERKQQLKDALSNYLHVPGISGYLNDYNKELFYYSQQLREYKEMFNEPDKLEQKALSILNQLPAFKDFMKNNSQLAGLFNIPGNYGSPQALAGLQTRDQIQQMIQSQVGSGPNAQSMVQQQVQAAQGQLNQFKDKLNALGGGSGDIDMPNFKPNNQKTKTLLRRLEFGTNLQTTRSSYFFPNTTDIGLSVGYKMDNKTTLGMGISYKIGLGKDIQHVHITNEGIGLRSFVDIQMKKSFFASGGVEYNYQQPFASFQQIRVIHEWQSSGLIGVSKIISIKSKVFKKTKLSLLWDFLSYSQVPRSQPVKFRVGYNF